MLSEKQREARKLGLGGSDAAGVIGWSKFKTPYDVWRDKTQNDLKKESNAMKIGNELESYVLSLYEKEVKNKVTIPDTETTYHHPDYKFLFGHLDGLISEKNIGVEVKTTGINDNMYLKDLTENKDWLCQVAHYSEILNLSEVHVFVYHRVTQITRLYIYKACESFQNALIKKEVSFWKNHVETLIPPSLKTLSDVKKHFSCAEDIQAVADENVKEKMKRFLELQIKKKEIEKEESEIKTDLFLEMGTANQLVDQSGSCLATWKDVESNRFDTSALKQTYPEIYEKFLISSKTRRFVPRTIK